MQRWCFQLCRHRSSGATRAMMHTGDHRQMAMWSILWRITRLPNRCNSVRRTPLYITVWQVWSWQVTNVKTHAWRTNVWLVWSRQVTNFQSWHMHDAQMYGSFDRDRWRASNHGTCMTHKCMARLIATGDEHQVKTHAWRTNVWLVRSRQVTNVQSQYMHDAQMYGSFDRDRWRTSNHGTCMTHKCMARLIATGDELPIMAHAWRTNVWLVWSRQVTNIKSRLMHDAQMYGSLDHGRWLMSNHNTCMTHRCMARLIATGDERQVKTHAWRTNVWLVGSRQLTKIQSWRMHEAQMYGLFDRDRWRMSNHDACMTHICLARLIATGDERLITTHTWRTYICLSCLIATGDNRSITQTCMTYELLARLIAKNDAAHVWHH